MLVILRHANVGEISGYAVTRNNPVEIFGRFKFTPVLCSEMTISAEAASDLPRTVSAEVEVDTHIAVANRCCRLVAAAGNDEWNNKLVSHIAVVRFLHPLHWIRVPAGFAIAVYHRVKGFFLPLPAAVAVHGIVTSADRRDLADAVLAHSLLQLFDITGSVGRQGVTPVHEAVDEDALQAVLLGHAQQGVEVILVRVNTPIGEQAEHVQVAFASAGRLHRFEQHWAGEQFAILDHEIDLGDVHVNNPAGTDVQVPDFAVAHLSGWQSDKASTGVNQRVGILGQQFVVCWLAGQRDSIGIRRGSIAPAVKNDEDKRFWSSQHGYT